MLQILCMSSIHLFPPTFLQQSILRVGPCAIGQRILDLLECDPSQYYTSQNELEFTVHVKKAIKKLTSRERVILNSIALGLWV
jgi:hypothetical protein